jgi:hypothetical protein
MKLLVERFYQEIRSLVAFCSSKLPGNLAIDSKGSVNAAGLPDSKEELRSRIQQFMRQLLHLPEHVRNYFQHPCIQYAAAN